MQTQAHCRRPPPPTSGTPSLAGFLGWTLDAFDFFILTFVLDGCGDGLRQDAAARSRSPSRWRSAMRPIGAVIFGLMADRCGPAAAADART